MSTEAYLKASKDNEPPAVTVAKSPFDDPKADLILCSSDNVHFYTDKLLLSLASSFFHDMFALPQGPETKETRQIVDVDERSRALEKLLTWCDPRRTPVLETIEHIQVVLELSDKYMMDGVGSARC
jgi:hypothetical protein